MAQAKLFSWRLVLARGVALSAALLVGWQRQPAAHGETLQEAWLVALAANPQLAAAELEQTAAAWETQSARSERWPAAWLQGSYAVRSEERNFRVANPLNPGQTFVSPYAQREGAAAAAGVEVPLYAGGAVTSAIAGAQARQSAAQHAVRSSRLDLLLAVGDAYLEVLRAERDLAVAEKNLASLAAHAADVRLRCQEGQCAANDMLAAQVAVSKAEQVRLETDRRLVVGQGGLNRLLARPLDTPLQLAEPSLALPETDFAALQQQAWSCHPELARLRAAAAAHQRQAEVRRAASRPQVSAFGRYDFEENRYQTPQAISTAGVAVAWDAFDGGQSRRAAAAELSRAASLNKLAEDARLQISLDLLAAWNAWEAATARRQVAQRALAQADQNARVARFRFVSSAAVGTDVLAAQALAAEAERDFYHAGFDEAQGLLRISHAAGVLGPR